MKRQTSGVTLIEQLIVIAIIAILSGAVLGLYLIAVRTERGIARQQEAMEELQLLHTTWRHDMADATGVATDGETSTRLALHCVDPLTSATETRVYETTATAAGRIAVDRERHGTTGSVSRQRLATDLDEAAFGRNEQFVTLSVRATRGFYPHNSTQQFTAIAAPGGQR